MVFLQGLAWTYEWYIPGYSIYPVFQLLVILCVNDILDSLSYVLECIDILIKVLCW